MCVLQNWIGPDYVSRISSETGVAAKTVTDWENGVGIATGDQLQKLEHFHK